MSQPRRQEAVSNKFLHLRITAEEAAWVEAQRAEMSKKKGRDVSAAEWQRWRLGLAWRPSALARNFSRKSTRRSV